MNENSNIAVKFDNVSKIYKLFKNDKARFRSFFIKSTKHIKKHAVKNASFTIEKGESVALFGRNGAGKSTVLKLIAGVAYPTEGEVQVNGRVSALLELSAGFDQEMTGLENIYFRGDVLGISRKEMETREAQIVEFADIGEYIHQPVRTYSSGMRARLGFAISANIQPDIIIVDEALSVGDKSFREKCDRKIDEILKSGVTFLFVTHSGPEARRLCKRGIVLKDGEIAYDGEIVEATACYDRILKGIE